jgi:MscS family membrane protein
LLALCLLLWLAAWPQFVAAASASATPQPEVPQDSLGRTTPRGAVLGFLIAARTGQYELAIQYLNTRLRGKAGAFLAYQLFTVLDRRLPPRLPQLSERPEGSLADPLRPNEERVGSISSDKGNVDIVLERVDRGKSGSLWLFSGKTLDAIPDLFEEIDRASLDDVLPDFVVNTRLAGIPLFNWLAVFVGMPLFYYFTVLLNRLLSPFVGRLRRRLYRKPELPDPEFLPVPVRLLLLAFVIHWIISSVSLPLTARQIWSSIATVITISASVWLFILLNSWTEHYTHGLARRYDITGVTAILRLARRVVDLLVIFAGVLVILYYFGVNPTAVLAGLGVGGIAVALAAQKTLENVIGGVSLILDQVVHVGDTLKVGGIEGTVEDMGLRSTRIRTPDRTVVSVPNGQIANMTLENFSARDKFWFHPILALRHGTPSPQMDSVLERIRSLLEESQHVEPDSVRVNFLRFGPTSLDVEVVAYVLARDWKQFLEIQERLLLRIMECIESTGVQIALPLQTILIDASTSNDAAGRASIKVPAPGNTLGNDAAAADSPQGNRSSP